MSDPAADSKPTAGNENNETATTTTNNKPVLQSAPIPPWHALGTIILLISLSLYNLPTVEKFDYEMVTSDTLTHRIFPDLISIHTLGYIRLLFAAVIWYVTYDCVVGGGVMVTFYLPDSKLHPATIKLNGFKNMLPFTGWAWILLGYYFTLSSYVTLQLANKDSEEYILYQTESKNLLRITIALWEMSAPTAIMVSFFTTYVFWPFFLKEANDSSGFRTFRPLMMHNANAFFVFCEAALLSGLSVRLQDLSLAPLVGIAYVLFGWFMSMYWTDRKYGPQFLYFFFDVTLPGYFGTYAIIGLLFILMVSYAIMVLVVFALHYMDGTGIITHTALTTILCYSVMRFRD